MKRKWTKKKVLVTQQWHLLHGFRFDLCVSLQTAIRCQLLYY